MTATDEFELYDYINAIFSKSKGFDPDNHNWENVSLTEFVNRTAHQLNDFVESCTWNARDCDLATDFVQVFTAFGVCYTFNGGSSPRRATEPGSSTGLTLVLNVEQYEYMRGPNNDAGIKILLHEPEETPEMADQGFVIAPGTHTLVNVNLKQVTYMPPPWGTCNMTAQPYHMCMADCRNLKAAQICGCRDVYMTNLSGGPERICNMNESFICIREAVDRIRQEKNDCWCNSTCSRTLFEPSLSYAMLSEFNIDQIALTTDARRRAVKTKFQHAMETQQRAVQTIREADETIMQRTVALGNKLAENLNATLDYCRDTTKLSEKYKVPDILAEDLENPGADINYVRDRINHIRDLNNEMKYNFWPVRSNLMQLIEKLLYYEEGYSNSIWYVERCVGMGMDGHEHVSEICTPPPGPGKVECETYMEYLCFVKNIGVFVLFVFKDPTENVMKSTAQSQMTKVDEYNNAVNWTFNGQRLKRRDFGDHFKCQENLEFYQNTVLKNIIDFVEHIPSLYMIEGLNETGHLLYDYEWMVDTLIGPHLFRSDPEKKWAMPESILDPKDQSEYDMEMLKCSWYSEVYDTELQSLDSYIPAFHGSISNKQKIIKTNFEIVVNLIEKMMDHYNEEIAEAVQAIQSYTEEKTSKKELSELLTGKPFGRAIVKFSLMGNNLMAAIQTFQTSYRSFPALLTDFYNQLQDKTFPFLSEEIRENYPFLKQLMSWYKDLGGKDLLDARLQKQPRLNGALVLPDTKFTESNIWLALESALDGFDEETGLHAFVMAVNGITSEVKILITKLDDIVAELDGYQKKIRMNTNFYLKNFVQLDIFYNELRYSTVNQIPAFDFGGFLGEVGGFLGLLLGASIVTVCELLDYIVLNCIARFRRKKKTDVNSMNSKSDLQFNTPNPPKKKAGFALYE